MGQGGNKPNLTKAARAPEAYQQQDIIIKHREGVSLITQEMRAQGMNMVQNMLMELERRNLGEVKTTDLMRMIIQMFGLFIPKPNAEGNNNAVIDIPDANVKEIIKQIGLKD